MARKAFIDVSRYQKIVDGAAVKAAGFEGIIARCTIGWSYVDAYYENNYRVAKDNGLWFGAYHVVWPANRAPDREAQWFMDHIIPQGQSQKPKYLLVDSELGTSYHQSGHHLVSGSDIIAMTVREAQLIQAGAGDARIYTAKWFWNHNKLKPYVGQGEQAFPLHTANYPWSTPPLNAGLDPTENYNVNPIIPAPWTEDNLWAWQWTSKWPHKGELVESAGLDANVIWHEQAQPPQPPQPTEPVPVKITYPAGKVVLTVEEV